jgi:hypothetical protein
MPLGKNRTGDYRNGNVVNWSPSPAHFGNAVTTIPANNDNPVPTSGTEINTVNWATPDPTHFGNPIP